MESQQGYAEGEVDFYCEFEYTLYWLHSAHIDVLCISRRRRLFTPRRADRQAGRQTDKTADRQDGRQTRRQAGRDKDGSHEPPPSLKIETKERDTRSRWFAEALVIKRKSNRKMWLSLYIRQDSRIRFRKNLHQKTHRQAELTNKKQWGERVLW